MKPYYEEAGIQVFLGDCREILPYLQAEAIITDPIWPNCEHIFPGVDAKSLLTESLDVANARRVAVHLGCHSDPRFLGSVPRRWKYLRTCYLEFACVGYLGRILRDADVAYVFGEPPTSKPGARVMPGRVIATQTDFKRGWSQNRGTSPLIARAVAALPHPAIRKLEHVRWLCKWFGGASVIDPFGGSGTTVLACKSLGIPCTMIEIEEKYCDLAVKRLSQEVLQFGETA